MPNEGARLDIGNGRAACCLLIDDVSEDVSRELTG